MRAALSLALLTRLLSMPPFLALGGRPSVSLKPPSPADPIRFPRFLMVDARGIVLHQRTTSTAVLGLPVTLICAPAFPAAIPRSKTSLPAGRSWCGRWSGLVSTSRPSSRLAARPAPLAGQVRHERHAPRSACPPSDGADHAARNRVVREHGSAQVYLPATVAGAIAVPRVRAVVRPPRRSARRAWLSAVGMALRRSSESEARGQHLHDREHRHHHEPTQGSRKGAAHSVAIAQGGGHRCRAC